MPLLMNFSATPVALSPNQMTPTAGRMKSRLPASKEIPRRSERIFPQPFVYAMRLQKLVAPTAKKRSHDPALPIYFSASPESCRGRRVLSEASAT